MEITAPTRNKSNGICTICDSYRTVNASIFHASSHDVYGCDDSNEEILSKGMDLSKLSPVFMYSKITGKSTDVLIDQYKSNARQKHKINWLKNILNPLSIFSQRIDLNLKKDIMQRIEEDYLAAHKKINQKVNLK